MSCPCDQKIIFTELDIAAGLDVLPRQIAGFPEFRRTMLAEIRQHAVLNDWHTRDEDDLGVMLLEMWAYVCDVLAFYDEAIANESYLRTADLRASLRKLTGLLGYIPRPAVAASVILTVIAEGRKTMCLKAGTAFRSQGFDGQAPQIFELYKQTTIHPLNNNWELNPQRLDTLGESEANSGAHDYVLLQEENKKLRKQDVLLITTDSQTSIHTLENRREITGNDEERYIRLDLNPGLSISGETVLENIGLLTPTQTVGLWTMGSSPDAMPNGNELILDGLYRQLKAGQRILVSKGEEYRWFELITVSDILMDAISGGQLTVENTDGDPVILNTPAVKVPATLLTLDVNLNDNNRKKSGAANWINDHAGQLIVHYAFIKVGDLTRQRNTAFSGSSDLVLAPVSGTKLEIPVDGNTPYEVVLQDVNQISVQGNSSVDYDTGVLDFQATDWSQSLTPPVKVFGNVLQASRGETVSNEILGSGDATRANQTFKLKKNPLTYISEPTSENERGVRSTLKVWVDGLKWQEVSNFYNHGRNDEVYIVRQNDDQETFITFGDGRYGRRLPSGTDNVIISYRYGAGATAPPANAITQFAKPIKGLTSINNPFAANGGGNAEDEDGIRDYAPQSALLLDRVVSLQDFIAATAGMPGIQAVHAQWRWNNLRQRPVVQVWYIGDSDSTKIKTNLHNLADPAIALDVSKATAVPLTLSFDVEVDKRYVEDHVLSTIHSVLTDKDQGMLSAKNIGIGKPLYRSQLFAAILAVQGTVAVNHIQHDGMPFDQIAIKPDHPDAYFNVEDGALIINGKEEF